MIQGPELGIFAPAFAGVTSRGVRLLVPRDRLGDALAAVGEAEER